MKVVVVGLGHVGIVTAAALIREGHTVVGTDTDDRIRELVARGLSPFKEPEVAHLLAAGYDAGRLSVTSDLRSACDADLAFVCVGTHGMPDGTLDTDDVFAAARSLGNAVRSRSIELPPMLLTFRSTMLPGTMSNAVIPALVDAASEFPGLRYEVAYSPEFSREGSAVADYFAPARIVIGERRPGCSQTLLDLLRTIDVPKFLTTFEVAELTKFADNSFHALKVAFANEIGRFAVRSGIPPADVFDVFLADTKLNLSASYLRPGGPFGGPCLGKDLRALSARMNAIGIAAPVLDHVFESNSLHIDFLVSEIELRVPPGSRLLLLGLSFKGGTDDVRNSPFVRLAEELLDRGYDLAIYDPDLATEGYSHNLATAFGQLPHRLSATVLFHLAPSAAWDLIVIAKDKPGCMQAVSSRSPTFHAHRL